MIHHQASTTASSSDGDPDYFPTPSLEPPSPVPAPLKDNPGSNRFTKWDACAAIRTKPRQRLSAHPEEIVAFSPDLVPLYAHPLIAERGLGRLVLLHHLYGYLNFTAILEHQYVNPITLKISRRDFDVPRSMIIDAYRIYCDEGYHALCSADMLHQVEDRSGVASIRDERPEAFRRLDAMVASAPEAMRPWVEFSFVIVSETLVSAILSKSHLDNRVESAIRQVIFEHAQDEAVHSAYFSDLMRLIWQKLPVPIRTFIGMAIPDLIIGFMSPDQAYGRLVLSRLGCSEAESQRIMVECHPPEKTLASIRSASTVVMGLVRSLGALDDESIRDGFARRGLLAPG